MNPQLPPAERTRCEVWSRVMGYHRPVSHWNTGKRQEHADRVPFRESPTVPAYRDEWPNSIGPAPLALARPLG